MLLPPFARRPWGEPFLLVEIEARGAANIEGTMRGSARIACRMASSAL
jgi:hypothetical protein